jgi:hypothetical protein
MLTYARLSGHNDDPELAARLPRIEHVAGRGASCTTSSTWRIRVEHGISHLKNRRALSLHLSRRERLEAMLRGRRADLQPATSPTTRPAPPTESSSGRHGRVIEPALARAIDGLPLTMHEIVTPPARTSPAAAASDSRPH